MKIRAILNNYRRSPSKVRVIAPAIVGLKASQARMQLQNLSKGSANDLLKLLESAIANAKNNFNLNEEELIVNNLIVNKGKVMKRWRPRAHGRAMRILKRSCHVDLILETIEVGNENNESKKSKKSKEKLVDKDKHGKMKGKKNKKKETELEKKVKNNN